MIDYKIGAIVRIKPGLRDRPSVSGKVAVVVGLENDRLRVIVAGNRHLIERHEVIRS
jgi:hypothetical protein